MLVEGEEALSGEVWRLVTAELGCRHQQTDCETDTYEDFYENVYNSLYGVIYSGVL